jgi:PIN domain nuclease of toxin-antitoxin system
VKLLLDTHVLLWLRNEPEKLDAAIVKLLMEPVHDLFVSAASAWEIAIKQSNGKLVLPSPAEEWFPDALAGSGLEALPITVDDALAVRALPWHHRDPFDRLLVAQALRRGLTLVTRDPRLAEYGVRVMGV